MTWQLSATPMRAWVGDKRGGHFRPVLCALVDRQSGFCFGLDVGKEDEPPHDIAARVLSRTIRSVGGAPSQVQVRDPELATALRRRSDLSAVAFEVVEQLDALDAMMREMEADLFPQRAPSLLEQREMSLERLRAFADGCALFYHARPWKQLHDEDVIEVQSPKPPQGMRCASVLGAGGHVMGIGFFASMEAFDRMTEAAMTASPAEAVEKARWVLMFHAADEVPTEDLDLWHEHALRVAGDDSIPMLFKHRGGGDFERADGTRTTFVEGLCRAIAATTEAEIDSGQWEKTVQTFDGPVSYRLSIPHLLAAAPAPASAPATAPGKMFPSAGGTDRAMRQIMRMVEQSGARSIEEMNAFLDANLKGGVIPPEAGEPTDPPDRAMDLCYQAQEARPRRELQLLREALRIDPDCAEAYVMLAQRESDSADAERLYRQGIEAGRRTLGEEAFTIPGYPFWGALESRPFMRAMGGLAQVLDVQGRTGEALEVLHEMLRLNPGDNQGMRYQYVPLLIEAGRLEEARAVIESESYRNDISALWDYSAALIAFRQGRTADADAALRRAFQRNRFVAPLILDPERMGPFPPAVWSPGDQSEAMMVAEMVGDAWRGDHAAMNWLRDSVPRPSRSPGRGRAKAADKRKGRGGGGRRGRGKGKRG